MIVGSTTVEQPFTQNTGNLGVDFVYDGYALRLVAQYKQAFGCDLGDFSAGVQVVHERRKVRASAVELKRVRMNTFFETEDGVLLCITAINDGRCTCTTAQGEVQYFEFNLEYVTDRAEIYRRRLLQDN